MIKIDGIDPKMIANNSIPFEPTHPGEILKDEIEFIVTSDGTVTGANYKRRCNERVDKEVMRLVNMLEGWIPATKGGQPCNAVVQVSMSIFPSFKASAQFVRVVQ